MSIPAKPSFITLPQLPSMQIVTTSLAALGSYLKLLRYIGTAQYSNGSYQLKQCPSSQVASWRSHPSPCKVRCRLEAMQTECTSALRTQRMPTTRNEEYRFTDVGPLLQIQPQVRLCRPGVALRRYAMQKEQVAVPATALALQLKTAIIF